MSDSYGFGSYVKSAVSGQLLTKKAAEVVEKVAENTVSKAAAYTVSIADHVKKISQSWKDNGFDASEFVKGFAGEEAIEAAKTVLLQEVAGNYLSLLGLDND